MSWVKTQEIRVSAAVGLAKMHGAMLKRSQKITVAEMRASGVRGLLIYCSDYHCSHWTAISGDRWPDDVRLPTCRRCGASIS